MNGVLVLVLLGLWIVVGVVSYKVGDAKGRGGLGLALGLLFGVLGLIVVAILPADETASSYAGDYEGPILRERDPVMRAIIGAPALTGSSASQAASIETRLQQLDALLARGVIDQAEYVVQRARIIAAA